MMIIITLTAGDGHIHRVRAGDAINFLAEITPQNVLISRICDTVDITQVNGPSSRL